MKYLAAIILMLCAVACHAADGYLAVSNGVMVIGPGGSGGAGGSIAGSTNGTAVSSAATNFNFLSGTNVTLKGTNVANRFDLEISVPSPAAVVTNLSQLSFTTNAGNVTFVNLPVVSASAGSIQRYSFNIAETNAMTIGGAADATSITNPTVNFHLSYQFGTNPLAAWPKAPLSNGWFAIVSSNGYPYILLSTNAAAGQATWASTNKLGW